MIYNESNAQVAKDGKVRQAIFDKINGTRPYWSKAARYVFALAIVVSVFLYMAIYTHVPLSLQMYQTYDDALFIRLGESLANGHWLGPFNQLTLVKGSGYPIFLALSSWLGAPVTLSQAIFYCVSILLLGLTTYKITGSRAVSFLILLLALFNPNIFQDRILRESIYTSQTIIFFCLSWFFVFSKNKKRSLLGAICAGLMLGWFWITREEGVWIIPGLVVLFFAKFIDGRIKKEKCRETIHTAGYFFVSFVFVLIILRCINFVSYKAFVGVDIKDPSFTSAMQQLQRAHVGPEIPYVPLSKETREHLYELSPAFSLLRPTLDPSVGVNPSVGSECWIWPSACHDLSAGQLFWQIRNGVAAAGKFASEKEARKYFRELAGQVSQICEKKEIPCYDASPIAMMPHLSKLQLKSIGPSLVSAWDVLLQKSSRGWIDAPPSDGNEDDLDLAQKFLNFPPSMPVASSRAAAQRAITLNGWFLENEDNWFTLDVPMGVEASVTRMASPDIAKVFPKAINQRFRIDLKCGDICGVKFVSRHGDVFDFDPSSPPPLHSDIHYGQSVIALDGMTIQNLRPIKESRVVAVSRNSRVMLYRLYSLLVPPLVYLGILAFLVMAIFYTKYLFLLKSSVFAMGLAALILSRSAILVVINISSFPSMTPAYFSPALCLVPVWAILSTWSVIEVMLARRRVAGVDVPPSLWAP